MHKNIFTIIFIILSLGNISIGDDFWNQTNGPFGGSVNSIVFDDSNYIYIATYDGGAYKSVNNGENWKEINVGLPYEELRALEINSNGVLFAGIDGEGIYRSSDSGGSWEFVSNDITQNYGFSLFINSSEDIFAGISGGGVYRSTDNGNSWTRIKNVLEMGGYPVFAENHQNELYVWVSSNFGIFKSTDNGDNWIELNRGYSGLFSDINDMFIDSSGILYAATDNGVFRSNDDSNTWAEISNGLSFYSVNSICVDENNIFYAGCWSSGVYYSTDMGNNWIELNTGLENNSVKILSINSNRNLFAGTSRNGVYRLLNINEHWQKKSTGITNIFITSLAASENDTVYAGSYWGKLFLSDDNGENWVEIFQPPYFSGSINDILISDLGYVFVGFSSSGIWQSGDGGNYWVECNNGISNARVQCLDENSQGDIYVATENGGVHRSENNGNSWNLLYASYGINSLLINHQDHIFIGTNRVFRSTDEGQTWEETNNGFREYYYIYDFAIDSRGVIFAATSGDGIYRSSNNGESWESVAYSTYWDYFTSIIVDNNDYIFASLENGGVIYSIDGGDTWAEINSGLKSKEVYALTFSPDNYIYAGTMNFGVFCSSKSSYKIMPPNTFNLGLNYPNPFNSTTTIPIITNSNADVILNIYNILGQKIRTIHKGKLTEGRNQFTWDGINNKGKMSPTGVYIYNLYVNVNKNYSGKMILMR